MKEKLKKLIVLLFTLVPITSISFAAKSKASTFGSGPNGFTSAPRSYSQGDKD